MRHPLLRLAAALITALAVLAIQLPPAAADPWYRTTPVLGIVDASREPALAAQAGAQWDRVLFLWQQIQPYGPGDWYLDRYVQQAGIADALNSGRPLVAVVQGTPTWAAGDPSGGAGAVPLGLDYPPNDPHNTFGQFMERLASTYKGRIDAWVIWNEPDVQPGQSGTYWTWDGNTADFFSLLRAGYRAVKQADPVAEVVFPSTTYFADATAGRQPFLARVLAEGKRDPNAAANHFYFDAVGVNLYCSLDAIYDVRGQYAEILAGFGLAAPIWLTETNCPVYDDRTAPADPNGRITTADQAAFLVQDIALARAAGYERIAWYALEDHDPRTGILDRWGLLRPDASPRPAFQSFQLAARYLGDASQSVSLQHTGTGEPSAWPTTRVTFDDLAKRTRVSVLWRTASGPSSVEVPASSPNATLVTLQGMRRSVARAADGSWLVPLQPPRVPQPTDPPGYASTGDPVLLVETDLPPGGARP